MILNRLSTRVPFWVQGDGRPVRRAPSQASLPSFPSQPWAGRLVPGLGEEDGWHGFCCYLELFSSSPRTALTVGVEVGGTWSGGLHRIAWLPGYSLTFLPCFLLFASLLLVPLILLPPPPLFSGSSSPFVLGLWQHLSQQPRVRVIHLVLFLG